MTVVSFDLSDHLPYLPDIKDNKVSKNSPNKVIKHKWSKKNDQSYVLRCGGPGTASSTQRVKGKPSTVTNLNA